MAGGDRRIDWGRLLCRQKVVGLTSETLRQRILRHEGLRLRAYKDTVGKLTIGVGRNIQDKGISEEEALYLLDNDIAEVKEQVGKALPWTLGLNEPRQEVLFEMCFQLGLAGLLGFKNTLAAIRDGNYAKAASGMLQSAWHTQTPGRCEELAEIMLNS